MRAAHAATIPVRRFRSGGLGNRVEEDCMFRW